MNLLSGFWETSHALGEQLGTFHPASSFPVKKESQKEEMQGN